MRNQEISLEIKSKGGEFWDQNPCGGEWASYAEYQRWIQATEPYLYEVLDSHDWEGKSVVEVGCGQGASLNYLPHMGASVTGLDMSFHSLQRSKEGAHELGYEGRVRTVQADAESLPVLSNAFEVVLSVGVLHHTPDTQSGINEIYRILKPGGTAIVMLYRSGNPKWWMTKLLRGISKMADMVTGTQGTFQNILRRRNKSNNVQGTALLELFGVPVLKAFSNRRVRTMFSAYSDVSISNYQPGFHRLVGIISTFRYIDSLLKWVDNISRPVWGFYQVVEAKKRHDPTI